MRDPERINRIVEALRGLWRRVPDQRLGQFLQNYIFDKPERLFYIEDDQTEKAFERLDSVLPPVEGQAHIVCLIRYRNVIRHDAKGTIQKFEVCPRSLPNLTKEARYWMDPTSTVGPFSEFCCDIMEDFTFNTECYREVRFSEDGKKAEYWMERGGGCSFAPILFCPFCGARITFERVPALHLYPVYKTYTEKVVKRWVLHKP